MSTNPSSQNVLAVDRAYVKTYMGEEEGAYTNTLPHFARTSERQLIIKDRDALMSDPLHTAIMVHVVLRIKYDNNVIHYCSFRRSVSKADSNSVGKVGIGITGYIDLADVNIQVFKSRGHIEIFRTVMHTTEKVLQRGLVVKDQAGVPLTSFERFVGPAGLFIADARKELLATNMAIVMLGDLPSTFTVMSRSDQIETLPLMSASELSDSGLPLNRWTQLCLEKLSKKL